MINFVKTKYFFKVKLREVCLLLSWNLIEYYKTIRNEDEYIRRYYEEVLDNLNQYDIIGIIRRISMTNIGRDIVLLCYESPDEFCHRRIVAKWLRIKGYKVEEYYK